MVYFLSTFTLDTDEDDLDLESATAAAAGAAWPPGLAFEAAAVVVAVLAAVAAGVVFGLGNFFLASSTAFRISSTVLGCGWNQIEF